MSPNITSPSAAAYERQFGRCPPLHSDHPTGDFVGGAADCRGPVCDASETLAVLRTEFDDDLLARSGILEQTAGGDLRLSPALCDPAGAVIALREGPAREPFDLLTSRGCLSARDLPLFITVRDAQTLAMAGETGIVYATPCIREVALLRSLGFAATLSIGLDQLNAGQLRVLHEMFRQFDDLGDHLPQSPGGTSAGAAEASPERRTGSFPSPVTPILVLLGWELLSGGPRVPSSLYRIAAHLVAAQRHLHMPPDGVVVWRPSPQERENWQFRVNLRDRELVCEMLRIRCHRQFTLERFLDPQASPDPPDKKSPANIAVAHANVVAELVAERANSHRTNPVGTAMQAFEVLLRRELIAPLQEWALAQGNPVVRNAALGLADLCMLLHRMSPALHELQLRNMGRVAAGDTELLPPKTFAQYLQLVGRFGSLVNLLRQLRDKR